MSRKRNRLLKYLLLYSSLLIIVLSIIAVAYTKSRIVDVVYVDYDFKIKSQKNIGFNADLDALHFGIIAPGTAGIRELEIKSEERARVLIKILDHDFIFPNRNDFIIEPAQMTSVQFIVKPPLDFPEGNYSGKVRIIFKRV